MHQILSPTTSSVRSPVSERMRNLTARERDVLEAMLRPESTKQTARNMGLSPRTVETHRSRVLAKLGARNIHELLVLFARPTSSREVVGRPDLGFTAGGKPAAPSGAVKGTRMDALSPELGILSGLTYSPRLDPTAITIMLVWGEEDARFGYLMLPEGLSQQMEGSYPATNEPFPVEGAIAYGMYLALVTRTRLRLGGDASVWDPDWGPLPQAPRSLS